MNRLGASLESVKLSIPLVAILAWAFLNFAYTNRFEPYSVGLLLRYFFVASFVVAGVGGLILVGCGRWRNTVTVVLYILFLGMFLIPSARDALLEYVRYRFIAIGVIGLSLLIGFGLAKILSGRNVGRIFLGGVLVLSLAPISQLALHAASPEKSPPAPIGREPAFVRTPNIYYLILDGYPRADTLVKIFGFDNRPFLDRLVDRGFSIADKSYSAYPWTIYSLGTTFRMNYATEWEPGIGKTFFDGGALRSLARRGYRLYYMPSHQDKEACPRAMTCVRFESRRQFVIGLLGKHLLEMVPLLDAALRRVAPGMFRNTINEVSDIRDYLDDKTPAPPFFFFGHIEMPHSPYIREADCSRVSYSLQDLAAPGAERRAFIDFIRCGNRQTNDLVDLITTKDPSAIVIIQSDHGSKFVNMEAGGWEKLDFRWSGPRFHDALEERYAVMNAWRLPPACEGMAYPDAPLVNTFRILFACLSDSPPDLLPERVFRVDQKRQTVEPIRTNGRWLIGP